MMVGVLTWLHGQGLLLDAGPKPFLASRASKTPATLQEPPGFAGLGYLADLLLKVVLSARYEAAP